MNKNIISCEYNSNIRDVCKLMKKHNIGFIPVKKENKYVGVITDRDICLACSNLKYTNTSIEDFISKNIISVDISSNIDDVLNTMSKYKIKRVLITDKKDIKGVISLSDILNYCDNILIIDTLKSIFYIHNSIKQKNPEIDEFYL